MIRLTRLTKRFAGRDANVKAVNGIDLEVPEGKLVSLLGPSGCGKTTTLRLIAGLARPDSGDITIGDVPVCSSSRGLWVGPHKRPIGIVFQSYAIWPHMTVLSNVMFPLRVGQSKVNRKEARERALAALELVGLRDLADRPAPALSGGQQQRVALARALVREPKVLLLDEPLSNLDAALRDHMRDEIRALQQRLNITTVFVTHDQDEALAVSDEVVVMNQGQIIEKGLPREIYAWPRDEFTAKFLGVSNTLEGVVHSVSGEDAEVQVDEGLLHCHAYGGLSAGDRVTAYLRPESFRLSRHRRSDTDWAGRLEVSIYRGDCWDHRVRVGSKTLKVRTYREKIGLSYDDTVYIAPEGDPGMVLPSGASRQEAATPEVPELEQPTTTS